MDEPAWKQLKLSLERLYKDDDGKPIPAVLDILPDGEYVYEPNEGPSAQLGENFRRIFMERGSDFFEQNEEQRRHATVTNARTEENGDTAQATDSAEVSTTKPMSPEELLRMRMEILPQLHIALGEMTLARDVLALFISSSTPNTAPASAQSQPPTNPFLPPDILSSSLVLKPQPIPSVQSFNAELVAGGKDEALRKASDLFKTAAESVERGCLLGERYWKDALKIRRRNWGLIPAPLPLGAPTGRGADRSTKDFLISFGLAESSPVFRRRALGQLASFSTAPDSVVFPQRQKTSLRVTLKVVDAAGRVSTASNNLNVEVHDLEILNATLRNAQREVLEQEIFAALIHDASSMSTASARVSERLIVIEAAQDTDLTFELVDHDLVDSATVEGDPTLGAKCDLIYNLLHILLLRLHEYNKSQRLLGETSRRSDPSPVPIPPMSLKRKTPAVLQPVIDLLQYEFFCVRVKTEMSKVVDSLGRAGVPAIFRFDAVGENGGEVIRLLIGDGLERLGGDAIIRIDNSRTLRFTFYAPSLLTAHFSQATLSISSIPQLVQLLYDETEQCLLQRICEVGTELSERMNGTWFVDLLMGRSVGKWEGCVLTFRVSFKENSSIVCSLSRLFRGGGQSKGVTDDWTTGGQSPLFAWVRSSIELALSQS
ncbi:hypothetical protein BV25DRAFT_1986305 [Artomyces pyxidatus]|uniref:Uncharacterized protein n=1 Tax=Artomyces pyxidatus TaxID=48021 RepID=A0ACB8TJW2_9AGAM|nr:hypothetical protein BV25DRAFT_1986305 [Artomyces pyxidatus]